MRNESGGFAVNIYGAMLESSVQVTSHSALLIPHSYVQISHSYNKKVL